MFHTARGRVIYVGISNNVRYAYIAYIGTAYLRTYS